jgi:hypothetical protein
MFTIKRNGEKIIIKDNKVSCSCCGECDVEGALASGDLRAPTEIEALRSMGRTCGRCGVNPDNFYTVWPSLPCVGGGGGGVLYGNDAFSPPDGVNARWRRGRACLRFYYRIVNSEKTQNGLVIEEGELNSGARSLLSAIEEAYPRRTDKSNLFVGEDCGLYIYGIEFYRWRSGCTSWTVIIGGAQPQGEDPDNECSPLVAYNQDMFTVGRTGPFLRWPPFFDENCEENI